MTSRRRPEARRFEPSGLVRNRQELKCIKKIARENKNVEYFYLRENEFSAEHPFDPYIKLEMLKVLDLSLNSISSADFLWGGRLPESPGGGEEQFPELRHLYLTGNCIESLVGFSNLQALETLTLSSNNIKSFYGLYGLTRLNVLSLYFNQIESFQHFPQSCRLSSLSLGGNPLAPPREDEEAWAFYKQCCLAITYHDSLCRLDGDVLTEEDALDSAWLEGRIGEFLEQGFRPDPKAEETVDEQADRWLLECNNKLEEMHEGEGEVTEEDRVLRLLSINMDYGTEPLEGGVTYPQVGSQITVQTCLQDLRPFAKRKQQLFHSNILHPATFKVAGHGAREVQVSGSMNEWGDSIQLDRVEEDGDGFFQAYLYLPAGDYEYRYNVDGVEKVSDHPRQSRFGKGKVNTLTVTNDVAAETGEDRETILHVRWLRSVGGEFEPVMDENLLQYTPTMDDVGCFLRVEILAYLEDKYKTMFFDVTRVVQPPDSPPATNIFVVRDDLGAEGEYQATVGRQYALELLPEWEGHTLLADWVLYNRATRKRTELATEVPAGTMVRIPEDALDTELRVKYTVTAKRGEVVHRGTATYVLAKLPSRGS